MINNESKVAELQKCADRHRGLHDKRRDIEYKIVFTLLAFYVSATWAIMSIQVIKPIIITIIIIGFIAIAIISSYFLLRLHLANRINIRFAENYEAEILKSLGYEYKNNDNNPIPEDKIKPYKLEEFKTGDYIKLFFTHNWGWQSIMILCFSIFATIILLYK